MLWFEQGLEWWRWLRPSGDVVARIYLGPNLRSRHPRTTCATTCLVWNRLLTNYKGSSELSYWMCGTGISIPIRLQGARGVRGYSVVPNRVNPMAKQDIQSSVNLCKGI
jgi:hypothetical protein